MATLQKLFISEGLPERPYNSLDSHVTYKSEMATAQVKHSDNTDTSKVDFHPITSEMHVTELRPIRLGSMPHRDAPTTNGTETWQRRLQSESALTDVKPPKRDHNYNVDFYKDSHQETRKEINKVQSATTLRNERSETVIPGEPRVVSSTLRTVTTRHDSAPSANQPPQWRRRERAASEFRRRDVSPDFKVEKANVPMVDGKCTCCPYGYHVDLDFLSYCDTMSSQSYLKQLKRIQREKRKLRKSMEVYLQDQDHTERTMHGRQAAIIERPQETSMQYQESSTNKLLDEIDSSVDQTINSIETMMKSSNESTSYSDMGTATIKSTGRKKFNTVPKNIGRQIAKDLKSYNETFTATYNDTKRTDSEDSLSSISTTMSEMYIPGYSTTETRTEKITHMTSEQLADTMAAHLPAEDGAASPHSTPGNMSKQSMQAMREAMSVSLQRMKELEDQVKAIPVLQVRISVLKEEKRLLTLQLKAQKSPETRTIGVGDATVSPTTPMSPRFDFGLKTPPPTAPKPKVKMAAVGDHSVLEPYVLQPDLPEDDITRVFQRDTIILDRAQKQSATLVPETSKPLTRSCGVGEGNVFDDSMHIHEKELRTVIIGQGMSVGKRNVGIECRPTTRDVGVSFNFDTAEKPTTRSVGVTTETQNTVTEVSFKSEEFTSALRNALHRDVRSVAIQADSRPDRCDVGIQSVVSSWNIRSVGVGDCSTDVEVRNRVATRNVSIDAFPDRMNRSCNTDYGWRLDAATNTVAQFVGSTATQTEMARSYSSSTMTDREIKYHSMCQTDSKVFVATDQLKTQGTNTPKTLTYNTGMNTILRPMADRGVNTIQNKQVRTCSVNTDEPRVRTVGVSDDTIDSFVCDFEPKTNDDDYYKMEEEGVETKTVYYSTEGDQEVSQTDKGYEIKREYGDSTMAAPSSPIARQDSEREDNVEVVEEKVWRTTGDGQFTVTTVIVTRVIGPDGEANIERESKTVTGGTEVLGSAADMILKEVEKGHTSSTLVDRSVRGSSSSISSSPTGKPQTSLERVLGSRYTEEPDDSEMRSDVNYSSSTSTTSGQGLGGRLGAKLDDLRLQPGLDDDGMSTSSSSHSHKTVQKRTGSPERVVSSYVIRSGSPTRDSYARSYDSGIGSSGSGSQVKTSMSSDHFSDMSSPLGTLRSIMKKSTSDPGNLKKGISFAETVTGGDSDSSGSENSEEEEAEEDDDEEIEVELDEYCEEVERGDRVTSETTDSDSSYEEGCYDSRAGSIVYKCKDDEAIAQGIPGAKMFDQNIREIFELNAEMKEACRVLATYLEDSTTIQTKQLNVCISVIQHDWFQISSSKLADAHQVEDYLSCFNEISKRLLEYIVNMQDANGNTSIHYAVSNCNFEVVNLLLDTGTCDLNKVNKAGYSAVIMATLASVQTQRQEEVVQRLFSMGDVNIRASKDGQTALMFAVRQGRTEMVKMLLDTGGDVNIQDDEGSTALMCAAEHGHTDICKLLLNTPGCDATIADNDGSTALSIAMEAGHKDAGVLLYAHVNFGPGQPPAQLFSQTVCAEQEKLTFIRTNQKITPYPYRFSIIKPRATVMVYRETVV